MLPTIYQSIDVIISVLPIFFLPFYTPIVTLPRLAFAADYWGDHAVVCRALENRPGPIVDQQFGIFKSWSQANSFAASLNQDLDLTPSDSRQIITSATRAAASVLRAHVADRIWRRAPVRIIQNAFARTLVLVAQRREHNQYAEQVSIKLQVLRPWLQGSLYETVAH